MGRGAIKKIKKIKRTMKSKEGAQAAAAIENGELGSGAAAAAASDAVMKPELPELDEEGEGQTGSSDDSPSSDVLGGFDGNKYSKKAARLVERATLTAFEQQGGEEKGRDGGAIVPANIAEMQGVLQKHGGAFDLRGKLGSAWSYAKANDPQLRADYEKVGTTRAAQQEFRRKWLEDRMEKSMEEHLARTSTHSRYEASEGEYKSVSKMWKDEGGDQAAFESVRNLVKNNWKLWENGKTFNGSPYIKFNSQKKVVQFLEITDKVGTSSVDDWSRKRKYSCRGGGNAPEEPNQIATPPLKGLTAAGSGGKVMRKPSAHVSPELKAATISLRRAVATHQQASATKVQCQALEDTIENDPAWAPFKNPASLAGIQGAKASLEKALDSPFWMQCTMMAPKEFTAYAKKNWSHSELVRMESESKVEECRAQLQAELDLLREQQGLRAKRLLKVR